MTMQLRGTVQLKHRLTAITDRRQILGRLALHAVREAKLLVPRRTGNLGRSIRLGTVTDHVALILAGGQRAPGYAAAVEFGSRPHVIVPRPGRVGRNGRPAALAWGGARTLGGRLRAGAGATHFARRVNHPGTRAHPYLRPGIAKAVRGQGVRTIVELWNGGA